MYQHISDVLASRLNLLSAALEEYAVGKFGVLYRKAFGEGPSETKRGRQAVGAVCQCDPAIVTNEVEEAVP